MYIYIYICVSAITCYYDKVLIQKYMMCRCIYMDSSISSTYMANIYIYICITYNTYDTTNNLPPNCKLQWHSNTNLPAELMASPIEPKSKTPPVMYDTLQIIVINIDKVYYIAIPTISIIYILLSKSDLLQDFFKTSPWPIIGLKDDAAPAEP